MSEFDSDDFKNKVKLIEKSDWDIMDFRKKKSKSQTNRWEQNIIIDKKGYFARIEYSGVDNGILIKYFFQNTSDKWKLIKIEDLST